MTKIRSIILILASAAGLLTGCLKTSSSTSSGDSTATLSECALNSATTATCKVSTTGSIVTQTFGANVTSWSNGSASTSVTGTIPNGYYTSKTATFTDALLVPANIKYGVTIFGVTGTDPGLSSNACRDLGTTQLSAADEATTYAGTRLPATGGYSYREVPLLAKDDEGTNATNATYVNRTTPAWGSTTCGTSGTLEQRIANCLEKFPTDATWSGSSKGNSGQASWSLVSRNGDCTTPATPAGCLEVWRDNRTKLLWSSRVAEAVTWCKAAGNSGLNDTDGQGHCTANTNGGKTVSACYEDGGTNYTITGVSASSLNTLFTLSLSSTPAVTWRLPTIDDYKQADIDGIRFVLPDMGKNIAAATATYEWSATVLSTSRGSAWAFDAYLGYVNTSARNTATYGVRCIGR